MAAVYLAMQLMLARYHRLLLEKERERAAQEEAHPPPGVPRLAHRPANRASFAEPPDERLRRAKRAGWPLALLFLDLDMFKRVNDSLGHDAGDRCCASPRAIRRAVREADMLFRMGGDEFTVLPRTCAGPRGGDGRPACSRPCRAAAAAAPRNLGNRGIGIALYPRDDVVPSAC